MDGIQIALIGVVIAEAVFLVFVAACNDASQRREKRASLAYQQAEQARRRLSIELVQANEQIIEREEESAYLQKEIQELTEHRNRLVLSEECEREARIRAESLLLATQRERDKAQALLTKIQATFAQEA